MLDRALLALADQRGTGQDHGQQRDLIDDLRHRRKPRRLQIGIELRADDEIDGQALTSPFAAGNEVLHFVRYGGPEIAGAIAGLRNSRCIDIDLDLGLALGENVGLKSGGISTTKSNSPLSILASISDALICTGALERRPERALRRSVARDPNRPHRRCRPTDWSPRSRRRSRPY